MTTLTTPSPLPALEEATCIVCLESLAKPDTRTKPHTAADDVKSHELTTEGCNLINSDIAYLVPCEHHLHDACLKPWVERANSCPVCRQRFNLVKLVTHVGGSVVSTYEVEDRLQRPDVNDISPEVAIQYSEENQGTSEDEEVAEEEDEGEDCFEGCRICGGHDNPELLLLCDDCDRPYHTYCLSPMERSENSFYCEDCQVQIAIRISTHGDVNLPRRSEGGRTRASQMMEIDRESTRRTGTRTRNARPDTWFSAWQSVWSHVDQAIHSTEDETSTSGSRQLSRMRSAWQRRVQVAENQSGSAQRLTRTAPLLLQASVAPTDGLPPGPSRLRTEAELRALEPEESLDSIRAWIALERARKESGIMSPIPQSKGTKRRMLEVEAMDREAAEKGQTKEQETPARPLKRPCRSLPHRHVGESGRPAPTTPAMNPNLPPTTRKSMDAMTLDSQPSFLNSLLQDVTELSSTHTSSRNRQHPLLSESPSYNPPTSAYASPSPTLNPTSPVLSPISSTLSPELSPALSPVSPSSPLMLHRRAQSPTPWHRSPQSRSTSPPSFSHGASETSTRSGNKPLLPARSPNFGSTLARDVKYGIRNVVSDALKPFYSPTPDRASTVNSINKDEFTVINRGISHKLYEIVGRDMEYHTWDEKKVVMELETGRWNSLVDTEVRKAIRKGRGRKEEAKG